MEMSAREYMTSPVTAIGTDTRPIARASPATCRCHQAAQVRVSRGDQAAIFQQLALSFSPFSLLFTAACLQASKLDKLDNTPKRQHLQAVELGADHAPTVRSRAACGMGGAWLRAAAYVRACLSSRQLSREGECALPVTVYTLESSSTWPPASSPSTGWTSWCTEALTAEPGGGGGKEESVPAAALHMLVAGW